MTAPVIQRVDNAFARMDGRAHSVRQGVVWMGCMDPIVNMSVSVTKIIVFYVTPGPVIAPVNRFVLILPWMVRLFLKIIFVPKRVIPESYVTDNALHPLMARTAMKSVAVITALFVITSQVFIGLKFTWVVDNMWRYNRCLGECLCDAGWDGLKCEKPCMSGTFGMRCSQNCSCFGNIKCLPQNGMVGISDSISDL